MTSTSRMQPYRTGHGDDSRLSDNHIPALSPGFQAYPPTDPTTSTAPVALSRGIASSGTHATPPSLTRMMTTTTMVGSGIDDHSNQANPSGLPLASPSSMAQTPTPMTTSLSDQGQNLGTRTPGASLSRSATTIGRSTPGSAFAPSSADTPGANAPGSAHLDKSHISASAQKSAKDAAGAAAKSFRVTLEDPCYKVLPAALRKYGINDDWRLYAMFICYGTTGESSIASFFARNSS